MSEDLKHKDEAGPEGARRMPRDTDTEGHRKFVDDGEDQGGPEGARRMPSITGDESDTEGHRK